MRKIYILSCCVIALLARENPFVPTGDLNTSIVTTNIKEEYAEFERQNVKFASDASLLLEVKFKYRVTDGTIKEKSIDINKTINFKNDYALMKTNEPKPVVSKKLDVSVTMPEKSVLKVVEVKDTNKTNEKNITSSTPKPSNAPLIIAEIQKPKQLIDDTPKTVVKEAVELPEIKLPLKSVKFNNFARFDVANENSLKILTTDKLVKHFQYGKDKIVIDLKHQSMFKTQKLDIGVAAFKNATIGWHKNYYRIVLALDKSHKYTLKKLDDDTGYEITLVTK